MPGFSPVKTTAKTTNYSVLAADGGSLITTRGAGGTVNFTLPDTSTIYPGWRVEFFNAADQTMTVTAATADTITTFNDLQADSVSFGTGGEKIGGSFILTWDGTGWCCQNLITEAQTITLVT